MRLFYKKIFFLFAILFSSACLADDSLHGLEGFSWHEINAVKNARSHSNMGNIYFREEHYLSALKEYQIAYNLTYNYNSSSTYLYNIALCFMKLGNFSAAKSALEGAIEKNCMNITYYKTLVDVYAKLNICDSELKKHLKDYSNPYNRVVAGLIFLKTDNPVAAKGIFDEFIVMYPDMIITNDIKAILSKL